MEIFNFECQNMMAGLARKGEYNNSYSFQCVIMMIGNKQSESSDKQETKMTSPTYTTGVKQFQI